MKIRGMAGRRSALLMILILVLSAVWDQSVWARAPYAGQTGRRTTPVSGPSAGGTRKAVPAAGRASGGVAAPGAKPSTTKSPGAKVSSEGKTVRQGAGSRTLAPGTREFMWIVRSPSAAVFLVGTLHMVRPNFYPLPKEMEKALGSADNLVLEIDLAKSRPDLIQALVLSRGLYPQGQSVSQNLSRQTIQTLESYLSTSGASLQSLERLRPWLIALQIARNELIRLGFNPELGLDRRFAKQAQTQGKNVIGLETDYEQIQMLSGFTPALQDKMLLLTLLELKDVEKEVQAMVDAWWKGDASVIDELLKKDVKEHPELEPVREKIYLDRNKKMADKIDGFLKGTGTYFVAVGSAHMVGEEGIVELLKRKGYEVVQARAGDDVAALAGPSTFTNPASLPEAEPAGTSPAASDSRSEGVGEPTGGSTSPTSPDSAPASEQPAPAASPDVSKGRSGVSASDAAEAGGGGPGAESSVSPTVR